MVLAVVLTLHHDICKDIHITKSVNLQYNMLARWDPRTKDSSTTHLMFQALFFSQFLAKSFSKIVSIYLFIKKIKNFECSKSIRNNEKKMMLGTSDAWSMSLLSRHSSEPAYYIVD
jgi:hypothetical protein